MTLAGFVLKNAFRNPRRTLLTIASIAVSLALVVTLQTLVTEIVSPSNANTTIPRVVTRHRTSLGYPLPKNYEAKIRAIPGVVEVTVLNWFAGVYKNQDAENFFPRFATDPEKFFKVFTDFSPGSQEEFEIFRRERTACLMGEALMRRLGLKIGDKIYIAGDIYPVNLTLTIRGTIRGPDEGWMIFNIKYMDELLGRDARVGTFWSLVESPEAVPSVIGEIDSMFRNSTAETKSETEKSFQLSFVEMLGNIQLLIKAIVTTVVFAILLVSASTMAMNVRERTAEIAVLKTLGFRRTSILTMIVAEGLLLGGVGGLLGVGGTYIVLPHPKWFMAIGTGVGVFAVVTLVALLISLVLPEPSQAASAASRALSALQVKVVKYGPGVSLALGLFIMLALFATMPAMDWATFSKGNIQANMKVTQATLETSSWIALAIGLLSSLLPGWNAARARVLDGLRHIG